MGREVLQQMVEKKKPRKALTPLSNRELEEKVLRILEQNFKSHQEEWLKLTRQTVTEVVRQRARYLLLSCHRDFIIDGLSLLEASLTDFERRVATVKFSSKWWVNFYKEQSNDAIHWKFPLVAPATGVGPELDAIASFQESAWEEMFKRGLVSSDPRIPPMQCPSEEGHMDHLFEEPMAEIPPHEDSNITLKVLEDEFSELGYRIVYVDFSASDEKLSEAILKYKKKLDLKINRPEVQCRFAPEDLEILLLRSKCYKQEQIVSYLSKDSRWVNKDQENGVDKTKVSKRLKFIDDFFASRGSPKVELKW